MGEATFSDSRTPRDSHFVSLFTFGEGYHRLWSHRSYDAHWSVQIFLLLLGSSTFEGPVIEWCNDHRIHHRYTDTEKRSI